MRPVVETYRRIPVPCAFVVSAIVAGMLGFLAGSLSAIAGIYI